MHTIEYKDMNAMRDRYYGHRIGDMVQISLPSFGGGSESKIAEVVEYGSDNNRVCIHMDGEIVSFVAEQCVPVEKIEDRVFSMEGLEVKSAGFHSWNDIVEKFKNHRDMRESTCGVTSGFAVELNNGWTVVSGGGSRGGIDFHEVTVFNATGVILWHMETEG